MQQSLGGLVQSSQQNLHLFDKFRALLQTNQENLAPSWSVNRGWFIWWIQLWIATPYANMKTNENHISEMTWASITMDVNALFIITWSSCSTTRHDGSRRVRPYNAFALKYVCVYHQNSRPLENQSLKYPVDKKIKTREEVSTKKSTCPQSI